MLLKITSFNVGLLDIYFFGLKIFEFTPHTRTRAEQLPDIINNTTSDILCLQEIYHARDFNNIALKLKEKYPYFVRTKKLNRYSLNSGLAIFSKFPIKKNGDRVFQRQSIDEGIFAKKGYLTAQIELPNKLEILIINTHTTAGGAFYHPESNKISNIRLDQLSEITKYIQKTELSYWVLTGDLNCGPEASPENFQYVLSSLDANDPVSILSQMNSNFEKIITWDPENPFNALSPHKTSPAQRIDHILLSRRLFKSSRIISFEKVFFENQFNLDKKFEFGTISDHSGVKCSIEIFDG